MRLENLCQLWYSQFQQKHFTLHSLQDDAVADPASRKLVRTFATLTLILAASRQLGPCRSVPAPKNNFKDFFSAFYIQHYKSAHFYSILMEMHSWLLLDEGRVKMMA